MSELFTVLDGHRNRHRHNPFYHLQQPPLLSTCCQQHKWCRGKRRKKRGLWWGASMDSRDRHRRRLTSLSLESSLVVFFSFLFYSVSVSMDSWNGFAQKLSFRVLKYISALSQSVQSFPFSISLRVSLPGLSIISLNVFLASRMSPLSLCLLLNRLSKRSH